MVTKYAFLSRLAIRQIKQSLLTGCILGCFISIEAFARTVPPPPPPPDLTISNNVDRTLTYNLGSTGLRGWIYTKPANYFESQQGRTTTASRQILVTHVGANSPADGLMKVNDIVLGLNGAPFTNDARISLGLAICEAEKNENQGILKLLVWRDRKTNEVTLKLRALGAYDDSDPLGCPKANLILAEACKFLEKEALTDDPFGAINGLALMATGKQEYLPKVRAFARQIAPGNLKLELKDGMVVWDWGYKDLFLCEYYLRTGDKEVLHGIHEFTVSLAKGQSMYGTFGHGIAVPSKDGTLHGSIPPYGPVNAAGLVANLAIVMGKKCGVTDPEVRAAIERANNFFGYYVDKGAIPYGEHLPWPNHDNNGKNAMAALLFAVQGDQPAKARFFGEMVTASYRNREYGHTGQGFSYLWGALGANVGGPEAVAAFFKQAAWHFDLERRCDGSFVYDGGEQYGPGQTSDNTYYGSSSYYELSPAACYVLTYSIPLKNLYITGKDSDRYAWLNHTEVAEAISAGRFDVDCKTLTVNELVKAFGNWSPVVRGWAATELALRPEAKEMVPQLIEMTKGHDSHVRQGACEALGHIKNAEALPTLITLLSDDDRWLRVKAAEALRNMGDVARQALPEILKARVETAEASPPIAWSDPVQLAGGELDATLFSGLLRKSLDGVDRKLLYPAIRATAKNPDAMARGKLKETFENLLTFEDVQILGPDILEAIKVRAPADRMFENDIRLGGLKALSKYHFIEGIQAAVLFAQTQCAWGSESRTGEIMNDLTSYGTAAKEVLPDLKALIVTYKAQKDFPDWAKKQKVESVEQAIKTLEDAKTQPELRTINTSGSGGNSSR